MSRESDDVDWAKIIMGMAIAGLVVYVLTQAMTKTEEGKKQLPPGEPPAPPLPGKNVPLPPSGVLEIEVSAGDIVLVATSRIVRSLPPNADYPEHMTMVVLASSPGVGEFIGAPAGESAGVLVAPFAVPKNAVVKKLGGGGGGEEPPALAPSRGEPEMIQGSPVTLTSGTRYRARLDLSSMEYSFASENAVVSQLSALGFTNVRAFKGPGVPSGWPAGAGVGAERSWYVEGTWGKPTQSLERPPQIALVWVA